VRALGTLTLTTFLAGCWGVISGGPGDGDDSPEPPREVCADGETDKAGPRLLRRLTSLELEAAVRVALGLSEAEWAGPSVPADGAAQNGFTNNVDRLIVDETYARGLFTTAEQVADVTIGAGVLPRVLPCATPSAGADCANAFLDTVGRRLYRRPLTPDERQRYLDLLARVEVSDDFTTWVRWATVAMLQSPHVIYRSELGEPDGDGYRLTGYELATALSFALTGGPPDDRLLDRAAAGELDTEAGVAAVARDLALDPATGKARPPLRTVWQSFARQWLNLSALPNLSKDPVAFPGFSNDVRDAMRAETEAFIDHVVFEDGGGMTELLTSPVSYVPDVLAAYYGWGGGGVAATRPAGWGVGLLAQGAVLSVNANDTYTSPTQRGLLVRERLLCTDLPPPPPVVGDIPLPTGNETTRERYELHASNGSCAGCHVMMDPIGFTFEHLDATGVYRETEGGLPIDDSGAIHGIGDPLDVQGPDELASALAALPETSECAAAFVASYTYGLDHHDTSCLVTSPAIDLAAGEIGLLDFTIALTATPHFTRRTD
jgi:hypothetical protein